jgi:hypothetical protein
MAIRVQHTASGPARSREPLPWLDDLIRARRPQRLPVETIVQRAVVPSFDPQ